MLDYEIVQIYLCHRQQKYDSAKNHKYKSKSKNASAKNLCNKNLAVADADSIQFTVVKNTKFF